MKSILFIIVLFVSFIDFKQSGSAKTEIKWLADNKGKKLRKEFEKVTDKAGNILKTIEYLDGNNSLCRGFSYQYMNGMLIKKRSSLCDGKGGSYINYSYDKLERVTEEVEYDEQQKIQDKTVHKYIGKSSNRAVSIKYDNAGKDYSYTKFEYLPNGLLSKETQTVGGSWFQTNHYKYDRSKKLIYEDTEVDGGVGVVKYYYIYKGNMLVSDSIKVPDSGTEYHIYETK